MAAQSRLMCPSCLHLPQHLMMWELWSLPQARQSGQDSRMCPKRLHLLHCVLKQALGGCPNMPHTLHWAQRGLPSLKHPGG